MVNLIEYIESGILESYALKTTNEVETLEVERMVADYPEVAKELNEIEKSLEVYALEQTKSPDTSIKAFLMATIDFIERLKNGEQPGKPELLNEGSTIQEFSPWLNRPDMQLPPTFDGIYARIINANPEVTTAIVWIKDLAPQEVHDNEYEKFLIVEGTCIITIDGEDNYLAPGSYLSIPLYKKHFVKVTSDCPCKAILQRMAA